jgi:hypothetical protein
MNDFNFYMERAEIPVLASEDDITRLREGGESSADQEAGSTRLKDSPRRSIASAAIGSTTWHLLEINSERAN